MLFRSKNHSPIKLSQENAEIKFTVYDKPDGTYSFPGPLPLIQQPEKKEQAQTDELLEEHHHRHTKGSTSDSGSVIKQKRLSAPGPRELTSVKKKSKKAAQLEAENVAPSVDSASEGTGSESGSTISGISHIARDKPIGFKIINISPYLSWKEGHTHAGQPKHDRWLHLDTSASKVSKTFFSLLPPPLFSKKPLIPFFLMKGFMLDKVEFCQIHIQTTFIPRQGIITVLQRAFIYTRLNRYFVTILEGGSPVIQLQWGWVALLRRTYSNARSTWHSSSIE